MEKLKLMEGLKKIELWFRTLLMVTLGGGVASLVKVYTDAGSFTFDPAGLLKLKSTFLGGMIVGLIGYWAQSPWFKPKQ